MYQTTKTGFGYIKPAEHLCLSEALRLLRQNAIEIDNEKVSDNLKIKDQ